MKQNQIEKESSTRMIAAVSMTSFIAVMSAAVAGAVIAGVGQLNSPGSVAVDGGGNIYVADSGNNSIKIFNSTGGLQQLQIGNLGAPQGVAVDTSGNIYVADTGNDSVKEFNSTGALQLNISQLNLPGSVAVDGTGNIYVANTFNDSVEIFNSTGVLQLTIVGLNLPGGVAVDGNGSIYVADSNTSSVKKFNSTGALKLTITDNLNFPMGVAVDTQGNIHVADSGNHRIVKFNSTGSFVSEFGTQGTLPGQFNFPSGIAVDGSGIIYVADTNNNRVQVFGGSGNITGKVTDVAGIPIANASVSVFNTLNTTDAGGNYTLMNIPAGIVGVTASKAGFNTNITAVTVVNGGTVIQNFTLTSVLNGTMAGMVTNVLQAPLDNVTITVSNATISSIMTLTNNVTTGLFNINIAAGDYNVTANRSGFVNTTLPVTVSPGVTSTLHITMPHVPVLTGVTVLPAAATILTNGTQALITSPIDQLGIEFVGATIAWNSSNPAVATVNATTGLVTGVALGTVTITANATNGTVFRINTSTITVAVPVLTSVGVAPATATLTTGGTQQMIASPLDQTGAPFSGAIVTWNSSNLSVATVNATTGLVTGIALGTSTITANATNGTVSVNGTSSITVALPVLTNVEVTPATATLTTGGKQQLTALPFDQTGTLFSGAIVTWNSNNPAVATVNATGLVTAVAQGSATITANATNGTVFKIGTSSITVNAPPCTNCGGGSSSSSGSSGGGGGGGGASGENFSNIILKEKYDEAIFKDMVTSYKFKNASNPITHVNVTGNNNAGLITAMIEVLKGTSTLVTEKAPGVVYMNVNTWLGTSGYATPKNLKEVVIRFRVPNSWMQGNNVDAKDIKLLRWDSATKKWTTLETKVKEKDGSVTYFEATTNALSPLAICAEAAPPEGPVAAVPSVSTPPMPGETPGKATPPQPKGTPGFEIVLATAALCVLYILRRR